MKLRSIAVLSVLAGVLATSGALAQDFSVVPTDPHAPTLVPHGVGGRAQPAGSGVQAPSDVREALVRAQCKHPPSPAARRPGGFRPRPQGPFQYSVKAIP